MNFFKRQAEAKRYTVLLLGYLLLAVALIVLTVNMVVYVALVMGDVLSPNLAHWLEQPWWILISLGTVAVVLIGSLVRYLKLRGGGEAVAEMMGARRLRMDTRDFNERRFINVVEEMSIASGTPVPDLFVMDEEQGINAFVAGYSPGQAVMVVTRGALENLDRNELQGVVAHEFSHILNGDMRLNVRLMAILAGILTLGVIGRLMMRSLRGGRVSSSGSGRGGQGQAAAFFIGLALFLIGYIGLFFGRLIKAAVSRQREFLADASSVQFTRNPDGIAGALWKIRQHANGSLLVTDRAEETSHMCFGQNMRFSLRGLLATHPPVDERIKRIDPHFRAKRAAEGFKSEAQKPATGTDPAAGLAAGFAPTGAGAGLAAGPGPPAAPVDPSEVARSVGNPAPAHMDYAQRLYRAIPVTLLDGVHEPETAPWVVYAILLGEVEDERLKVALALVKHKTGVDRSDLLETLARDLERLDVRFRLPLVDMAIPSLRRMPVEERRRFIDVCEKLVQIDRRVTSFELVLMVLVRKFVLDVSDQKAREKYRSYDAVMPEIRILLTFVARSGTGNQPGMEKVFTRVMRTFSRASVIPADESDCRYEILIGVLEKLAALSPLLKESLLAACADCVMHDGRISKDEAELLRAISESLDCPMPPLDASAPLDSAA